MCLTGMTSFLSSSARALLHSSYFSHLWLCFPLRLLGRHFPLALAMALHGCDMPIWCGLPHSIVPLEQRPHSCSLSVRITPFLAETHNAFFSLHNWRCHLREPHCFMSLRNSCLPSFFPHLQTPLHPLSILAHP